MLTASYKQIGTITSRISTCSRCGRLWRILGKDIPYFQARIKEDVCWECEPEGW